MKRLTAYCDLDFLELFLCEEPETRRSEYAEADRLWGEVFDFLRKEADIIIDAPDDDVRALVERLPHLRFLYGGVGPGNVEVRTGALLGVGTASYHGCQDDIFRVYCTEDVIDSTSYSERFGALFVNALSVKEEWSRLLGRHSLIPVGRDDVEGSIASFEDLNGRWTPSAALVVVDRYMFGRSGRRDGKAAAVQNLVPLLRSLLPQRDHDVPVEVLLVGEQEQAGRWNEDAQAVREWIELELTRKNDFLQLDLSVALVPNAQWGDELHDRRIFMGYVYIESGHSIKEYFEGTEPKAKSRLTPSSLADATNLSTAVSELREVDAAVAKAQKLPGVRNIAGTLQNRLLAAVR